jgi:hypothetical protein
MLLNNGDRFPPYGVPCSLWLTSPSAITPLFKNFFISVIIWTLPHPAPGFRRQVLFSFRFRRGMQSLTRSHKSSVSSHDLIPLPAARFISSLSALPYLRITSKHYIPIKGFLLFEAKLFYFRMFTKIFSGFFYRYML